MISPTRIEVRNIGSVGHAVVEPHPSGITVLDGPTGSGKSTIINAVCWALYGYIGGVNSFTRQGELRSACCPDGEPAEAVVEFTHAGQQWKVVRRLRRTKTGKESASAELWLDGVKQRGITPDKLTEKITMATGMSGRAYTSAFFIPQMQLERMAHGTPSDIQALIEEQTGLVPLTKHLAHAAVEVRDAAAAAEALPGSRDEVEQAQEVVDDAQVAAAELWAAKEAAAQAAATVKELWQAAAQERDQLAQRRDAARVAELAAARLEAELEAVTDEHRRRAAELTEIAEGDVTALTGERDALAGAARDAAAALRDWGRAVATYRDASARAADADVALAQLPAREEIQRQLATLQEQYQQALMAAAEAKGQQRATRAALAALEAAGQVGHSCPMCRQQIADATQLKQRLQAELQQHADAEQQSTARQQYLTGQRGDTEQQLQARQRAEHAAQAAGADQDRAASAKRTVADQGRVAADALRGLIHDSADVELTELTSRAQQRAAVLTDQIAVFAARDALAVTVQQLQQKRDRVQGELARCRDAAQDRVEESAWTAAVETEAEVRSRRDSAMAAAAAASQASAVASQSVEHAEQARDAAQARLDAKLEALTRADVLRGAHEVLAQQRRELLAEYTASISDAASMVMAEAGGGRHVGVHLDETFEPKVVLADGSMRPFRNCSGGEKLRAALCLCLGQVSQQDQAKGGMLLADEIATGYDEATTADVMEMISGLGRPMVLIGHQPATRQIAQKVYSVALVEGRGSAVMLLP